MAITITGGVTFSGGSLYTVLTVPTDAQFNYVSALFSGEGTNTAQNNTFVDGSTNNFTITRTGTPTQGSFSPYGSNWSNYFNGSTDYLTAPANAALSMGSGDFTWEMWIYPTTTPSGTGTSSNQFLFGYRSGNDTSPYLVLNSGSGGTNPNILFSGDSTSFLSGTFPTLNQWSHIAITRSGTALKMFLNGAVVASTTNSTNFSDASIRYIAAVNNSSPSVLYYFPGYISNLRIVKGTAVYTAAFTPPTAPLTAITNTSLLTCQSSRFVDNSTNAFAITISGSPSVQRYNPFGTSTTYSIGTIGGAGYFNGSTDWLSTPSTGQFAPTGDFTIECWFNMPSLPGTYYELFGNYNANISACWEFEITSTGAFKFYNSGGVASITTATGAIKPNTWYHACMTRSGTTITGYINGVSVGTTTQSGTFGSATIPVYIASQNATLPFKGYISDARLVDGTSVYTSNFTPPTAPLGAISGTKLLLNFTNAGIYDNAMMTEVTTVGSAQISTAQYKFGSSSMKFNGTTDYLSSPVNLGFDFGTGDFTVELWTNYVSTTQPRFSSFISYGGFTNSGPNRAGWSICLDTTSNLIYVTIATTAYSWSFNPTTYASNWFHLAVVRNSGSLQVYVNGTALGAAQSATGSASHDSNNYPLYIGQGTNLGANQYFSGYIDDLRITNGYARYTSNFVAPTSAFPTVGPVAIVQPPTTIQYLVVAGGGSGTGGDVGNAVPGGGGGAGGVVSQTTFNISASTLYTITVGAGGTYVPTNGAASQLANPGNDSSIHSLVVAKGGGGGGYYRAGGTGGSGGSGGYNGSAAGTSNQSSAGTIPAGATGYGNPGVAGPGLAGGSGGGGGAGAAGTALAGTSGSAGGVGITSTIITTTQATTNSIGEVVSTSVYFAGGGGGGSQYSGGGTFGTGGSGGGGKGGTTSLAAVSGLPNTGGGGGSAPSTSAGGSGGSGVVIIKYADTYAAASSTTGSPTIIVSSGYRIYIWTGNGSITF